MQKNQSGHSTVHWNPKNHISTNYCQKLQQQTTHHSDMLLQYKNFKALTSVVGVGHLFSNSINCLEASASFNL